MNSGYRLTIISVLVIALSVLLAAGLAMLTPGSAIGSPNGQDSEEIVKDGRLPGYEDAAINEDPTNFLYLINSQVVFQKPGAPGTIMLENTTGNTMMMRVTFVLDETGETIYTSPKIFPNQYVDSDSLSTVLPKGKYSATAEITTYDLETEEERTSYLESITITVEKKLFGLFG